MSTRFSDLIPQSQEFLTQLGENNTRAWFAAHKPRYEAQLKSPAMALLDTLGAQLEHLCGQPLTPKLFRIHRDLRFAKDKTPYHTHLHLMWGLRGTRPDALGFFFGVEPDKALLGAGRMGFSPQALTEWRSRVDGPQGDTLNNLLTPLLAQGFTLPPPELKRIPAPYRADHPRADLLRRKSLSLWQTLPGSPDDLPATLMQGFARLHPLVAWLRG